MRSTNDDKHMVDSVWIKEHIKQGKNLGRDRDLAVKQLKPFNLANRIQILSGMLSYGQNQHRAAKYLIWFIDKFPESPLFLELPVVPWSQSCLISIEAAWEKVISRNPTISIIRNAITTLGSSDISWALELIGQDTKEEFSFELTKLFFVQYKRLSSKANEYAKRSIQCAKQLDEFVPHGEKFGILKKIIPLSLAANDHDASTHLTKQLLTLSRECKMPLWQEFALIFQVRIALKQNKPHIALLGKLQRSLQRLPVHVGASLEMIDLFQELQKRGFKADLVKLLKVCLDTTSNEHERKGDMRRWLREVEKIGWSNFEKKETN